jgi:hypothetical protein
MARINNFNFDIDENKFETFQKFNKPKQSKPNDDKLKLSYKDKSNRKGNRFDRTNMDISI